MILRVHCQNLTARPNTCRARFSVGRKCPGQVSNIVSLALRPGTFSLHMERPGNRQHIPRARVWPRLLPPELSHIFRGIGLSTSRSDSLGQLYGRSTSPSRPCPRHGTSIFPISSNCSRSRELFHLLAEFTVSCLSTQHLLFSGLLAKRNPVSEFSRFPADSFPVAACLCSSAAACGRSDCISSCRKFRMRTVTLIGISFSWDGLCIYHQKRL
jgi:hypothetical protein